MKVTKAPKNRLQSLISRAGGITAVQAVSRAEANILSIKAGCLNSIKDTLQTMRDISANIEISPDRKTAALYRYSNDVLGIAGAINLDYMVAASFSLCEALDQLSQAERWNQSIVDVHISALTRLRNITGRSEECEKIIEGLKRVANRA